MPWTHYRDPKTGHTREIYTTESGQSYAFTRDKMRGRQLNFDTPIRFEKDAQWQAAIDRGLGTHATSIITRARAHLGSYIALVEKNMDRLTMRPKLKKINVRQLLRLKKNFKIYTHTNVRWTLPTLIMVRNKSRSSNMKYKSFLFV